MGVVIATIKSNGTEVSAEFGLLYIDIIHEYNKIPYAEISYLDGDLATQEFNVSDSAFFEPGGEIEIKLRYDTDQASSDTTVFKGIVIKQGLQTSVEGCTMIAELSDTAVKMTATRKSAVYEDNNDSSIISKIISGNGLSSGTVQATKVQHKRLVQYYTTDWDFMLSRAEINGLFISVKDGKISALPPNIEAPATLSVNFGIDEIYDFEVEADARNQYETIESSVWDVKGQQLTAPKKAKSFNLKQGNLTAKKLAGAVGGKKDSLIAAVNIDEGEAQAWADSKMMRTRLSMLKGRVKVQGTAAVNVGDVIELKGMGKRFSGPTLVTGVRQQVTAGGWTTDIQFGLSGESFSSKNANIIDSKAAGLLPGVNGLQIGIVLQLDDPEKESRVKVKIPAIDNENDSIWSRLARPDAGKERGMVFWPEVGDEVILGFFNDDPRDAVILGAVHSSANTSPIAVEDKNPVKGIVTRQGLKMLFNDEEKTITISTSDDSSIIINEKDKSIELKDVNNNSVKLSDKGISLESKKDIIINAGANVKIEGKSVEIKGNKVDVI